MPSLPSQPQSADFTVSDLTVSDLTVSDLAASDIASQPDGLGSGDFSPQLALETAVTNFETIDAPALDAQISGVASGEAPKTPTPDKLSDINGKAKRGIKMMMGRQAILQVLTFGGGIVLARLLDPATFGIYVIVTFLVTTFGLLGNFGLAPSLVQRKGEIKENDLRVAFTMQQIIITVLVMILMIIAPYLVTFYPSAPPSMAWLIRAMAFTLYLSSWRTMSQLQLERQMRFDKIARVEIVETAIYQLLAVILALMGFGIWSFVIAALTRGLCGTILSYIYAPWPVRFAYDRAVALELLRFGLPFQAEALTSSLGAWITPVFVGSFLGPQAVGYLTFASSNGRKPLMLADNFITVSFPHFSRLQDDLPEVERILVRYLTYLLLAAGLWSAILVVAGGALVELIYGAKWRPAEHALIIFSLAVATDVITRLISVAITALGHVKIAWSRTASRTAVQLLLSLPALYFLGYNGMPYAYLLSRIITMPFLFTALSGGAMKRVLGPTAWIVLPWLVSIVIGCFCMNFLVPAGLSQESLMRNIFGVLLSLFLVGAAFAIATFMFSPNWLKNTIVHRQKAIFHRG